MPAKVRNLRQDLRWPKAHERLRELFRDRVPEGMTQEEFGELYGIGTQGMVWQYLNGWTPLNIEAAEKFAAGLNCTIADISPEMASYIKERIVVRLGKISRRVAMFIAALALQQFSPHDAQARSVLHNSYSQGDIYAKYLTQYTLANFFREVAKRLTRHLVGLFRNCDPLAYSG